MVGQDNSTEAAQWLHEDRVSDTVQAALAKFEHKRWILFHAKDYLLGVLQLLESFGLLRDRAQEELTEKWARAAREESKARLKGYQRLVHIAAGILPDTYDAEVKRIATVRTMEELEKTTLTNLTVAGWAHAGSGPDAIALDKVRKLARQSYKRKTINRADLLEALGWTDE